MPPSTPDHRLRDCRVLVVEDTYFIADDIAAVLRSAGAVVVGPAPSARTAMALLSSERVDAAVLDINLHGVAVYPVADMLRAQGTPFVFASGYGRTSIPAAYRDIGILEKPFDSGAVVRSLLPLIGHTLA